MRYVIRMFCIFENVTNNRSPCRVCRDGSGEVPIITVDQEHGYLLCMGHAAKEERVLTVSRVMPLTCLRLRTAGRIISCRRRSGPLPFLQLRGAVIRAKLGTNVWKTLHRAKKECPSIIIEDMCWPRVAPI